MFIRDAMKKTTKPKDCKCHILTADYKSKVNMLESFPKGDGFSSFVSGVRPKKLKRTRLGGGND